MSTRSSHLDLLHHSGHVSLRHHIKCAQVTFSSRSHTIVFHHNPPTNCNSALSQSPWPFASMADIAHYHYHTPPPPSPSATAPVSTLRGCADAVSSSHPYYHRPNPSRLHPPIAPPSRMVGSKQPEPVGFRYLLPRPLRAPSAQMSQAGAHGAARHCALVAAGRLRALRVQQSGKRGG